MNTPELELAKMEELLEMASGPSTVKKIIEASREMVRLPAMKECPELEKKIQVFIRKAHRKLTHFNTMTGALMSPKILTGSQLITAAQMELDFAETSLFYQEDGQTFSKLTPLPEISSRMKPILDRPEAGWILDSILLYMDRFTRQLDYPIEHPEGYIKRTEDSGDGMPSIVIRDTFNSFCKNAGITGETRKAVKKALKEELLRTIDFVKTINKRTYVRKTRFITLLDSISSAPGEGEKALTRAMDGEPDSFTILINENVFDYVKEYQDRKNQLPKKGQRKNLLSPLGGWDYTPAYLNKKIADQMNSLTQLVLTRPTGRIKNREYISETLTRNPERWRQAILYILKKWNTGKEKRKGPMIITFQELSVMGYLPKNTKNPDRRKKDIYTLTRLLCGLQGSWGDWFQGHDIRENEKLDQITISPRPQNPQVSP